MANMNPNIDNLKPIRDSETARKLQQLSSQKQKENHQKKLLFKSEIERQLGDRLENVIKSMLDEAENGNVQATTFLRDTLGEKPRDELELSGSEDKPFEVNINVIK